MYLEFNLLPWKIRKIKNGSSKNMKNNKKKFSKMINISICCCFLKNFSCFVYWLKHIYRNKVSQENRHEKKHVEFRIRWFMEGMIGFLPTHTQWFLALNKKRKPKTRAKKCSSCIRYLWFIDKRRCVSAWKFDVIKTEATNRNGLM